MAERGSALLRTRGSSHSRPASRGWCHIASEDGDVDNAKEQLVKPKAYRKRARNPRRSQAICSEIQEATPWPVVAQAPKFLETDLASGIARALEFFQLSAGFLTLLPSRIGYSHVVDSAAVAFMGSAECVAQEAGGLNELVLRRSYGQAISALRLSLTLRKN